MTQTVKIAQRPKTKIVGTLSLKYSGTHERITELVIAGLTVARLNFSHGTIEEHQRVFDNVRAVSESLDMPVGIMVDIPGPKYRTGPQSPGAIDLTEEDSIILTSEDDVMGSPQMLSVSPPGIHSDAQPGDEILVDDGNIKLRVLEVRGMEVECVIVQGGRMTERRGVVIPGRAPSLPFLSDRDMEGLAFAAETGADFVALSNVTQPEDVGHARGLLKNMGSGAFIVSKIETAEAIGSFDAILAASDGIMVARGDLGVAIDLESVPLEQERMIEKCNLAGKPVITATQMLESMVKSSSPTRAEATDVSNAVREGSDAVMLSGETAQGKSPAAAVDVMRRIAMRREAALDRERKPDARIGLVQQQTDEDISFSAARIASNLDACGIIAFTEYGNTARRVSKYKPTAPILALTPHEEVSRVLTVSWGVNPVIAPDIRTVGELLDVARRYAISSDLVPEDGGKLVLTAGFPFGESGSTNFLHVMDVVPQKND